MICLSGAGITSECYKTLRNDMDKQWELPDE
jgi:hypothetical protein